MWSNMVVIFIIVFFFQGHIFVENNVLFCHLIFDLKSYFVTTLQCCFVTSVMLLSTSIISENLYCHFCHFYKHLRKAFIYEYNLILILLLLKADYWFWLFRAECSIFYSSHTNGLFFHLFSCFKYMA